MFDISDDSNRFSFPADNKMSSPRLPQGFHFFKYHIILELKANFTVRRHILLFFCY